MIDKNRILVLYYDERLKQKEIAKKLNISKSIVSRTVKKDSRYESEKELRKVQNKKKHNKQIQNRVEEKRRIQKHKNAMDDLILKAMHYQASSELSQGKKSISNRAYRDWNTSAYKYNSKTKSYHLRKEINAGADVPKKIKWE